VAVKWSLSSVILDHLSIFKKSSMALEMWYVTQKTPIYIKKVLLFAVSQLYEVTQHFYSCTATSVIHHSCLPHSTLLPVPTSPRWVTTCKELIALLVPIWTLQTEVKTALCKLNDTVLGELGKELQTQIKWPNITDYQVTHIPSLPPPA